MVPIYGIVMTPGSLKMTAGRHSETTAVNYTAVSTDRLVLTFWPWSWTYTVQHNIYVKCEYFMNQEG